MTDINADDIKVVPYTTIYHYLLIYKALSYMCFAALYYYGSQAANSTTPELVQETIGYAEQVYVHIQNRSTGAEKLPL